MGIPPPCHPHPPSYITVNGIKFVGLHSCAFLPIWWDYSFISFFKCKEIHCIQYIIIFSFQAKAPSPLEITIRSYYRAIVFHLCIIVQSISGSIVDISCAMEEVHFTHHNFIALIFHQGGRPCFECQYRVIKEYFNEQKFLFICRSTVFK